MKAVVQRVSHADVKADGLVRGEIGRGFMVLLGVEKGDTEAHGDYIADKLTKLRIFGDGEGKMNLDICSVGGDMLVVSQFTLITDIPVGNRPFFGGVEEPARAEALYRYVCARLEERLQKPVARGVFGAHMEVSLTNDGPVTIILNSRDKIKD